MHVLISCIDSTRKYIVRVRRNCLAKLTCFTELLTTQYYLPCVKILVLFRRYPQILIVSAKNHPESVQPKNIAPVHGFESWKLRKCHIGCGTHIKRVQEK